VTDPVPVHDVDVDLVGPAVVTGHLVAEGDVVVLATMLAETFPPQPGGASLAVVGLDDAGLAGLQRVGRVAWSDQPVVVRGTMDGGRLVDARVVHA
jgi:hypothetical protein